MINKIKSQIIKANLAYRTGVPIMSDVEYDQVITFNKNIVDILSKLDSATTTTDSTVSIDLFDAEGILRNFKIPSFTSLKSEIDRLNNNINSLYSIDADGAMIQTSNQNKFRKTIILRN